MTYVWSVCRSELRAHWGSSESEPAPAAAHTLGQSNRHSAPGTKPGNVPGYDNNDTHDTWHMTHRKHRIPVIISLNTQLNLLIHNKIKTNVIEYSSRMLLWLDAKFQREYKLISPVSPLSVLSNFAGGSFRSDSLLVSLNRFLFGKFWKNVFL